MAESVELDISVSKLKADLQDLQKELQKTGAAGQESFGLVSDEITALLKEMQDLAAVQREAKVDIKSLEGATAGWSTRIKAAIRDTQVFGKSIGDWKDEIGGVINSMTSGVGSVGKFSGAFKVLSTVIKASGLGILIGIVGSLIQYFTKFQSGIDKVSQVMSAVSAVVDVLVNRFLSLASAIGNFFSGNWSAAADDLSASVSGIATELVNAASAAYDLEKAFQQLRDDSRTAGVELARQNAELAKLKAIADDDTRSIGVRSAAQKQALALEAKMMNTRLDLAQRQLDADQKNFFLHKEDAALRNQAAKSEIDYLNLASEANTAQLEAEQKLRELRKKAAEERQKIRDKEAADEKKRAELRVAVLADDLEKEIAAENLRYDRLLADLQKYFKGRDELNGLIEQAEKQHRNNIAGIYLNEAEKEAARQEELRKLREAQGEFEKSENAKNLAAAQKNLDGIKKLRDSEIDVAEQNFKNYVNVLKANGATKEDIAAAELNFDRLVQSERLKAEIEFQEGLLALTSEGDKNQIEIIKNKIALLNSQLQGLSISPSGKGKKKNFFFDLLGIKDGDEDKFKQAMSSTIKAIEELKDAKVKAAEEAVAAAEEEAQAAEDKVAKAQDALETELDLAKAGFASKVTQRREELAAAEQEEVQAKQRREKALEDQRKAQKSQAALDTVLQVSNLITSATQVIKGFSAIPILGVPLGIAAVALMVGSFIKSKIAARNAVKAREGIQGRVGDDGIVVGPSHENEGVPLEVEGGEFLYQDGKRVSVVKKSATAAHFGLLKAINDDDRPAMVGYLERLTGGVRRDIGATNSAASGIAERAGHSYGQRSSEVERLLAENNRLTAKLLEHEQGKVQYIDMGDHVLKVQKGHETRIKKR